MNLRRLLLDPQFWRFVVIGLVATAVHYSVLTLLLRTGLVVQAGRASAIASVFGIATSYTGNRWLVFRSSRPVRHTLPYFLGLYGLVAAIHYGLLTVWTDHMGLPYTPGFLIATCLSIALSFLGNRFFVFRQPDHRA